MFSAIAQCLPYARYFLPLYKVRSKILWKVNETYIPMIIYDILINVVTNYNSKSLSFTLLLRRGNCIAICHNVFLCFNQKLPRHCMCLNLCIEFCNRINFPLLLTLIILWQVPYFILLIHSLRQMFSHVGISG